MAPRLSDRQVTLLSKAFVVVLLLVVLVSAYFQLRTGGDIFELLEVAVSLYIVSVVALGVFRDSFDTRRFRIALYVGVVAWALVSFVGGNQSVVTLLLLVLGALLLTRELTFGGD